MNVDPYKQLQYAIFNKDANRALSLFDASFMISIISDDSDKTLCELLTGLFEIIDAKQIIQFTLSVLTPETIALFGKDSLQCIEHAVYSLYEKNVEHNDPVIIEKSLFILILLSTGKKTRRDFYEYLTLAHKYFASINNVDIYLEFLYKTLPSYGISDTRQLYSYHYLIAILNYSLTHYHESILEYEKAGEHALALKDYECYAICNESIGVTYGVIGNYSLQLHFHILAKSAREEHKLYDMIGNSYVNIGLCYMNLGDKEKARDYYQQGISHQLRNNLQYDVAIATLLLSKLVDLSTERIRLLLEARELFSKTNDLYRYAETNIDMGDAYIQIADYNNAIVCLEQANEILIDKRKDPVIGLMYKAFAQLYFSPLFPNYDESLAEKYIIKAIELFTELDIKDYAFQALEVYANMLEQQERWQEHSKIYKEFHALQQEVLNAEVQSKIQAFEFMQQKEREDHDRRLQQVKYQEQEKLLHAILPSQIAAKIVGGQSLIAEAAESVSVFFMDIVEFTEISSQLSPTLILNGLNEVFSEIDQLAAKHAIEKIKTIGDAYMAVASIPNHDPEHAFNMSAFALDVMDRSRTWKLGDKPIAVRIGIHVGPVVGGVIGKQRFTYDVWGDTVNIASRLESSCEPDHIHISQELQQLLSGHPEFMCKNRGEITLKGRGVMQTFWLYRNPLAC